MKKVLSLLLAFTMLLSIMTAMPVFADGSVPTDQGYTVVAAVSGGNDEYGWKVDGTTLYLYYTGAPVTYTSSDYTNRPWNNSAASITKVVIAGTPTEIGAYTFNKMTSLADITFAGTETRIQNGAFAETAFTGVFTIPKSVTWMHGQAFQNLKINVLIFEGDAGTSNITLNKGLPYLGDLTSIVLMRPATISSDTTTVKAFGGAYAGGLYGMTNPAKINMLVADASYMTPFTALTEHTDYLSDVASGKEGNISAKEYSLAPGKFGEYTLIDRTKGVTYGDFVAGNVTYLLYDENTAADAEDLTVEFISDCDSENGSGLMRGYTDDATAKTYTINDSTLSTKAASIKKMVFGEGFTQIPAYFGTNYAGGDNVYGTGKTTRYESLQEVVLPATMTTLGKFAFGKIKTLSKVNLEDTKIKSIAEKAFAYCPIEKVTFPSTIATIDTKAFVGNTALETVYLPSSASLKIGNGAFAREWNQSGDDGKNLKVIVDGDAFTVDTSKVDATAFTVENSDWTNPWRTTTLIYDSSKWTAAPSLTGVTAVADEYYDMSVAGNTVSLWMYTFGTAQNYTLLYAGYNSDSKKLVDVDLKETAQLASKTIVDTDITVNNAMTDATSYKAFLWDDLTSLTPLTEAK